MKKLLSVFSVLLLSTVLVFALVSRGGFGGRGDSIDLSEGRKLYKWNVSEKKFKETSEFVPSRSDMYHERLSPTDGIYYRSASKNPIKIEKTGSDEKIELQKGVFICDMQDATVRYEIRSKGFLIRPLAQGVFLLDTTQGEPVIFSYNSFLSVTLYDADEKPATALTLFPSLLFKYNQSDASELKNADIIRVSTIDSIRYLDAKKESNISSIFGLGRRNDASFFSIVQNDIASRIQSYNQAFSELQGLDLAKFQNSPVAPSNPLFLNPSKKEVILKNLLLEKIFETLKGRVPKTAAESGIKSVLDDMKEESPSLYDEGIRILKRYYYLSAFVVYSGNQTILSDDENTYRQVVQAIVDPHSSALSYHGILSLFSRYYFGTLAIGDFNAGLKGYLGKLLSEKTIKKTDFLPFSFFLTQYLSVGPFLPDENTLGIMFQLFSVTNDYYNTIANETDSSIALSTIFYSYNKSFSKLLQVFTDTFFERTEKGLLLKPQYLSHDAPTFEQSFLDLFKDLATMLGDDLASKKQKFYLAHPIVAGSNIDDNYSLLYKTYEKVVEMKNMLLDYGEYTKSLELDDRNRTAQGVLLSNNELSQDSVEKYLATFDNTDISTLKILNNFQDDGFYDLRIDILGNAFYFKMWPEGHTISDISYIDGNEKKHVFPNVTITLDQKMEQMKDRMSDTEDLALKYRYDFKNFFETTFIREQGAASTATGQTVSNETPKKDMSPELQLFVQRELIEKDFKNIVQFLLIGFSNIYAEIKNGSYAISLSSIKKNFSGANESYSTIISGKYLFDRHSFFDLSLQVDIGEGMGFKFDGANIKILPSRIRLADTESYLKDIGKYIDTIQANYRKQSTIEIDLLSKKVRLDGQEFIPDLTH